MSNVCAALRRADVTAGCAAEQAGGPKPLHAALALTKLERQASARRLTSAHAPAAHHAARSYQRARATRSPGRCSSAQPRRGAQALGGAGPGVRQQHAAGRRAQHVQQQRPIHRAEETQENLPAPH